MPGGETPTSLSYQGNIALPTPVEAEGSATAPAAGTTIVTTSPQPGLYIAAWQVWLESGTPGTTDANNFGLYVGSTLVATSINPATVGAQPTPQGSVEVTVPVSGTVLVKAIASSNGTSVVYAAQLTLTPAQVADFDDPLYPYNPLTVDGQTVVITSTPVNVSVTMAGFDTTGSQAECVLGTGTNVPAGTTNFGFVDTTYLPTQAQQLTVPGGAPAGSGYYGY